MKTKIWGIWLVVAVIISLVITALPAGPVLAESLNAANVSFDTTYGYTVQGDSFINGPVTGTKNWSTGLNLNSISLDDVNLQLSTGALMTNLNPQVSPSGSPGAYIYHWPMGNLASGSGIWVNGGRESSTVTYTPGFDASVTGNTNFPGDGDQTLNLTVTPRQPLNNLFIAVNANSDQFVSAQIISPSHNEAAGIYNDGQILKYNVNSPLSVNQPFSLLITIHLDLHDGVNNLQYRPWISINTGEQRISGSETGSSFTRVIDAYSPQEGAWTWSSAGSTTWVWNSGITRCINFQRYSISPSADVDFNTNYGYSVYGDSFINGPVVGYKDWNTHLNWNNIVLHDVNLDITTGLHLTGMDPDTPTSSGPPNYNWSYGTLEMGSNRGENVRIDNNYITYTPGFDVSRSVNTHHFTSSGTQSLTLVVTPRQTLETLNIFVNVKPDQYATPHITFPLTDQAAGIYNDGQGLKIHIENPDQPSYTFAINISLALNTGVDTLEYLPWIGVSTNHSTGSGAYYGTSISRNEDSQLGTRTWRAAESITWLWKQSTSHSVYFQGYSGPGTLSGRITDTQGNPLPNVSVDVGTAQNPNSLGTLTDSNGYYIFGGLPFGNYTVRSPVGWGPGDGGYIRQEHSGLLISPASPNAVSDFTLALGSSISGIVKDTGNNGIGNIHVYALDFNTGAWINGTNTAADGSFTLGGLPNGSYRVHAGPQSADLHFAGKYYNGADGVFDFKSASPVEITAPGNIENINFILPPGGTIYGRVTDAVTHQPLGNISVNAASTTNSWGFGATTDINGFFALYGLPFDSYKINSPQGFGSADDNYIKQYYNSQPFEANAAVITTSENTPDIGGINFALRQGSSISGHVYERNSDGSAGAPLAEAVVQLITANRQWVASVTTGNDGSYCLHGVDLGSYYPCAWAPEHARRYYNDHLGGPGIETLTVSNTGNYSHIDFKLEAGGAISGKVASGQNGLSQVNVAAMDSAGRFVCAIAVTDGQGKYTITGLPFGDYLVYSPFGAGSVNDIRYSQQYYQSQVSPDNATPLHVVSTVTIPDVNFDLSPVPARTISGHVYDFPSGNPLAGASVQIMNTSNHSITNFTTGTDGAYSVSSLDDGQYLVIAFATGHVRKQWPGSYSPGTGTLIQISGTLGAANVDFPLEAGGVITGRVTAGGSPLANISVKVDGINGNPCTGWVAVTDSQGQYTLNGLYLGDYQVCAASGVKFPDGTPFGTADLDYVPQYYDHQPDAVHAGTFRVTATGPLTLDFNLEQPRYGGILRIVTSGTQPASLGYPPDIRPVDVNLVLPALETLIKIDSDRNPVPCLAGSWNIGADSITFNIRQNVKFHDGSDLNAEVVVWNFQQLIAAGKLPYAGYWSSIEQVDTYSVVIHTQGFCNQLLEVWGSIFIISRQAFLDHCGSGTEAEKLQNFRTWAATHVVGTGPFTLVRIDGDHIRWVRNAAYWQSGRPYLDGLDVRLVNDPVQAQALLESGQADEWDSAAPVQQQDLENKGYARISNWPGSITSIWPNTANISSNPWNDPRVRIALEYALDKAALANIFGSGYYVPMTMLAPPGEWGYDSIYAGRDYNPLKAKVFLSEAGYPNGFKTTMLVLNDNSSISLAATIQAYLAAVGIDCTLNVVSPPVYFSTVFGCSIPADGLVLFSNGMDSNYLSTYLHWYSSQPGSNNVAFLGHTQEQQALDAQALLPLDAGRQKSITTALVNYMTDNALIIPLWKAPSAVMVQTYVHTDRFAQGANSWNIANTWIGGSVISVDAPTRRGPGSDFTVTIDISDVFNLDAAGYTVCFDPAVLSLIDVTAGSIGSTSIPVSAVNPNTPGQCNIVQNIPGASGVSGSGTLAVLHFRVVGSSGSSSQISLSYRSLSNIYADPRGIPALWFADSLDILLISGDADGDCEITSTDITMEELIVAKLRNAIPGADANQDGRINAIDITKIERLVAHLD